MGRTRYVFTNFHIKWLLLVLVWKQSMKDKVCFFILWLGVFQIFGQLLRSLFRSVMYYLFTIVFVFIFFWSFCSFWFALFLKGLKCVLKLLIFENVVTCSLNDSMLSCYFPVLFARLSSPSSKTWSLNRWRMTTQSSRGLMRRKFRRSVKFRIS